MAVHLQHQMPMTLTSPQYALHFTIRETDNQSHLAYL